MAWELNLNWGNSEQTNNIEILEKEFCRLSVQGSRSLGDERVKTILLEIINEKNISEIITHAEPEGVCQVARELARELAIPLKLHFLNFKYLRGAFEHRSKELLKDSDFTILIHDGVSQGTKNELSLAKKMKIPYLYKILHISEFKKSVGFSIEKEWEV
jgi:hypothetical protein